MNILEQIMKQKAVEVSAKKEAVPLEVLKELAFFQRPTVSAREALIRGGIIAEHKRKSPSKPSIQPQSKVQEVVQLYDRGDAAVMSILTDTVYFGGSLDDLLIARTATKKPLLRKDFIYDSYQVYEAKAYGADLILLIAAVLSREQIEALTELAHQLGLEVLLEVHSKKELEAKGTDTVDLLGVNHRDLKTFKVDLDLGAALLPLMRNHQIPVAESGLQSFDDIQKLHNLGFKGFLIGEYLMKEADPSATLQHLNTLFA